MDRMLPYIIILIAVICIIITIVLCRLYTRRTFNSIDSILDRILSKDAKSLEDTVGENRSSKLVHKANKIINMSSLEIEQNKEEKETVQGFISDMSHQMKTPLAGISMYSDLLLEGNLSDEEQTEFLNIVKSSTEKLQWMMNSLIKMSRLEVGSIVLSPSYVNIKPTLSSAISSISTMATKKNIDIIVEEFDDISLYHDQKWTHEVFVNILENAIKYSPQESNIEVSKETFPLYTKIVITNYGVGIPKHEWNLIFKRFYRGENVKNDEGSGLGLYLAQLIMEKQGGYITVDSVEEENTTFSIFLQNCKN